MSEVKPILDAFNEQRGIYEAFTDNAHVLIETLLKGKAIEAFRIESRTKTAESFKGKIDREDKKGKYNSVEQVTDVSGLRIINYLEQECTEVTNLLRQQFDVDEGNSIDKASELALDRFGYQSTHLVISYRQDRTSLEEFKRFSGLKMEVQVKTILQHAWASIDWKLRYKSTLEAPTRLRRRLYRISALLEAADDEFSFVSTETLSIRKNYEEAILRGDLAVGIDRESVEAFISAEPQVQLIETITKGLVGEPYNWALLPVNENSSRSLVKTINYLGLTSLDTLKNVLDARIKDIDGSTKRVNEIWKSWGLTKSTSNAADIMKLLLILDQNKKELTKTLESCPFSAQFTKAVLDTAS